MQKHRPVTIALIVAAIGLAVWLLFPSDSAVKQSTGPAHVELMKRLNPHQYRNTIRDIFGGGIDIEGRFVETGQRAEGLLAIGASHLSVTSMGFEAFEGMAREIAAQVTSERHRAELVGCQPAVVDGYDAACAKPFISSVGRLLYRRPLTDNELQVLLQVAQLAATDKKDFYAGLEKSLTNMLVSPHFLFRVERSEPDPEHDGEYRLTAYGKATRLSYLLWNSAPDSTLLAVAESGEIHTEKGLQGQVDRMLESPRLEAGVRAFFDDMLAFNEFDTLAKDKMIFPQFTRQVANDSREQTLRTIVDHLLTREGDYRKLFTTPKTFLTPSLAALLGIPLMPRDTSHQAPDQWLPYEFPKGDQRAGILAQPSFVALHAPPGRSSPTKRGKALRENVLCQEVPAPPANVDFNIVEDTDNPDYKTTRQRLSAHAVLPTCAGCHKIIDPIGLAFETFDGDGSFRTTENGVEIDTTGEIDGVKFANAAELSRAVGENPNVVSCVVDRVFAYGTGDELSRDERKWLKGVRKDFASDDYRFKALLSRIAGSEEFYRGHEPGSEAESVATR